MGSLIRLLAKMTFVITVTLALTGLHQAMAAGIQVSAQGGVLTRGVATPLELFLADHFEVVGPQSENLTTPFKVLIRGQGMSSYFFVQFDARAINGKSDLQTNRARSRALLEFLQSDRASQFEVILPPSGSSSMVEQHVSSDHALIRLKSSGKAYNLTRFADVLRGKARL
jgi:hypothetical protein